MKNATAVTLDLYKIMIPVLIGVKILDELGMIQMLSGLLEPFMQVVGLPGASALVWGTTLLLNLYAGMIVIATLGLQFTIEQITVLSTMMLVAHNIPIEGAICTKSGTRFLTMTFIRIGGAYLLGFILHVIYSGMDSYALPAVMVWQPVLPEPGLINWAWSQVKNLFSIYVVITGLMLMLALFDKIKINAILSRLLAPILRLIGIGRQATTITLVGITLGLAYGGGLIIDEAKSGKVSERDVFYSLTLMGLCHSLIEDTLLMVVLGASLSGILWGRIVFSVMVVFILVKLLDKVSNSLFNAIFAKSIHS